MNNICKEHELEQNFGSDLLEKTIGESWEKINRELDGVNPHAYRLGFRDCFAKFCKPKPSTDFHIEENLKIIEERQWDDIWGEFQKDADYPWADFASFYFWLKQNYLAPEKK